MPMALAAAAMLRQRSIPASNSARPRPNSTCPPHSTQQRTPTFSSRLFDRGREVSISFKSAATRGVVDFKAPIHTFYRGFVLTPYSPVACRDSDVRSQRVPAASVGRASAGHVAISGCIARRRPSRRPWRTRAPTAPPLRPARDVTEPTLLEHWRIRVPFRSDRRRCRRRATAQSGWGVGFRSSAFSGVSELAAALATGPSFYVDGRRVSVHWNDTRGGVRRSASRPRPLRRGIARANGLEATAPPPAIGRYARKTDSESPNFSFVDTNRRK